VSEAYRVHRKQEGTLTPTHTIFLTFETPTIPEWVTVLYTRFHVKPYLSNPMRCFRCQKFGHKRARCTSDIICPMCGMKDHGDTFCSDTIRCINYSGDHISSSPDCPTFLQEKASQKIRVEEHVSFPEARKKYFELQPEQKKVTYAQATASRPATSETSTQTDDPSTTPATALKIRPLWTSDCHGTNSHPKPHRTTTNKNRLHVNRAHLICPLAPRVARERAPPSTWSYPARAWIWTRQTV
jgi:hypothetical protein